MFVAADGHLLAWPDGRREHVDSALLATGYRPDLGFLWAMGALDGAGLRLHASGLSLTHVGLAYVGLEWQCSSASATLRGVAATPSTLRAARGRCSPRTSGNELSTSSSPATSR
jgi:putative flavoprotein involved in K+ transport